MLTKSDKVIISILFLAVTLVPGFIYIFNQSKANEEAIRSIAQWQSIMSEPINDK